jgi:hypothetical protein
MLPAIPLLSLFEWWPGADQPASDAKLILMMANEIGDQKVLEEMLRALESDVAQKASGE